ncbi:hypothetical protein [Achromobacter sp. AGC39]
MSAFAADTLVIARFDLFDAEGNLIVVDEASYRLTDHDGQELIPLTELPEPVAADAEVAVIEIPAEFNSVAPGLVRELRQVELVLKTPRGTIRQAWDYIVEIAEVLAEHVNSFQTYGQAVMAACDLPNIPGWTRAPKRDRVTALVQARLNLARMRYRYVYDGNQSILEEVVLVRDLTQITLDEWRALPNDFVTALRRAQVIEADAILGGDEIGDIRRAGIVSKSTGESKHFYRANLKAIERPICARAMREMSKWVLNRMRLGRTA